jgi:hypothetical protein
MPQTFSSPDPLLITIVLGILAIGLPIVMVLLIRFLWDRNLALGRSKELEKLIWQLHRIASAMEHQMNLSFPPVQPGTEEARDLAYLQQLPTQPQPAASPAPTAAAAAPVARQPEAPKPQTPPPTAEQPVVQPAAQQSTAPPSAHREPSTETPAPRAGVNSMFGL